MGLLGLARPAHDMLQQYQHVIIFELCVQCPVAWTEAMAAGFFWVTGHIHCSVCLAGLPVLLTWACKYTSMQAYIPDCCF